MKGFVIDIETDGLSLESNIRFVGVKDIFSGDEKIFNVYEDGYSFVKDELSKLFNSADVLVGYNINKFDLPLIKNFFEIISLFL